MREFRSFAALGDSFTEGVGDPTTDGTGCRGWADRFAEELARQQGELRYANLAIRGKVVREVLEEQVPVAVAMRPDLVSLAAGGNDMLRFRTDPDDLAVTFEEAVATLAAAGCTVMAFTGFDPKAFPVLRLIRGKAAVFSMHIREIAAKYDCLLADLWPMRALTDRRLWSSDRLHLSEDGHYRVALLASETAGLEVADDWRAPLTPQLVRPGFSGTAHSWLTKRWSDVEWMTEHAAPYISRRLHGVSSGDGIGAKRPVLAPTLTPTLTPALTSALAPEPLANAAEPAELAELAEPVGPLGERITAGPVIARLCSQNAS